MAHQPGWIELYELLENDIVASKELLALCKSSRSGLGETFLHWYAIEGAPEILQKIIELGFNVNVQNDFGATPVMEAAFIGRWDNVKVLLVNGADLEIKDENEENFFEYLAESEVQIPSEVQAFIAEHTKH